MSSILLLLDDGEMQQLGTNSGGCIVLAGNQGDPGGQFSDAVITSADGGQLTLGSHFLTTSDGAGGEQVRPRDEMMNPNIVQELNVHVTISGHQAGEPEWHGARGSRAR